MDAIVVRYETKPGQADENERLVQAVFAELRQTNPGSVRYAAFRLADGVSFVHVAVVDAADGHNPIPELPSFLAFQDAIGSRLVSPPVSQDATLVGSYRFFPD